MDVVYVRQNTENETETEVKSKKVFDTNQDGKRATQADRLERKKADVETNGQTRQTVRQTGRQTDRQTERQIESQTD